MKTLEHAIEYSKEYGFSVDIMEAPDGEFHVVDPSALDHYKRFYKHVASVTKVMEVKMIEEEQPEADKPKQHPADYKPWLDIWG